MRKILLAAAMIVALAMPFAQAQAFVPPCPEVAVAVGAGAATFSTALFSGAVGLGAFATVMIATGQHFPVCDIDGVSCAYSYPTGKNGSLVKVQYFVPQPHQPVPLATINHEPYHVMVDGQDTIRQDF